jgi:hypothetical protein
VSLESSVTEMLQVLDKRSSSSPLNNHLLCLTINFF